MKTILKSLLTASLLLASMSASAQCVKLEKRMNTLISEYSEELCTNKTINETRDPFRPDRPLTSKCAIYYFTLKKKSSYQRELLDEMLRAMKTEGGEDPNCYSVNSMNESSSADNLGNVRRLMIGENPENFIEVGKDYNHFYNVNAIDTADATKSHRYAYAVEWREKGKTIELRYIVTYAKIPSATTTITQPAWPYIDLGRSRIRRNGPIQAESKAQAYFLGKGYPIQSIDSLIQSARMKVQEEREAYEQIRQYIADNRAVVWNDSLRHETDPVTDVVSRLHQGQPITSDDLLCNDNIRLIFSQLKQQYLSGQKSEFNAISIYTLCKRAREYGFFTNPLAKAELDQLKDEVMTMYNQTEDKTCSNYLQMAFNELEKIQQLNDVP